MFVGRYKVHDSTDAGFSEQGLFIEVDDPGVILQDVVVLLQAVLQSPRLHNYRLWHDYKLWTRQKLYLGGHIFFLSVCHMLLPSSKWRQRAWRNQNIGVPLNHCHQLHSTWPFHGAFPIQTWHYLVERPWLGFVGRVNYSLYYPLVSAKVNRLVCHNLEKNFPWKNSNISKSVVLIK